MSAAVLSRHVVSVPPRQTVHYVVTDEDAISLRLASVQWDDVAGHHLKKEARERLYLASSGTLGLDEDTIGLSPRRIVDIGNCSDTQLIVEFEIRGDS